MSTRLILGTAVLLAGAAALSRRRGSPSDVLDVDTRRVIGEVVATHGPWWSARLHGEWADPGNLFEELMRERLDPSGNPAHSQERRVAELWDRVTAQASPVVAESILRQALDIYAGAGPAAASAYLDGRPGSLNRGRVTVAQLEAALRASGSPNRGRGSPNVSKGAKPWDLLLAMDSADVPDELLVAVLIAGGRGDPVEKARKLLASVNGSVGQIVEGSHLSDVKLTDQHRARLKAGAELARRAQVRQYLTSKSPVKISSPHAAVDFLQRVSRGPREVLSAIYLNRVGALLGMRKLSEGGSAATIIDPIEVLRPAITLRAGAFMLAHQHPTGAPEPSHHDKTSTTRLKSAAQAVGISFHDHIIIGGDGRYISMAEQGYM
jgi:DNA repair protein RadC